jgi:hypothetical protein
MVPAIGSGLRCIKDRNARLRAALKQLIPGKYRRDREREDRSRLLSDAIAWGRARYLGRVGITMISIAAGAIT